MQRTVGKVQSGSNRFVLPAAYQHTDPGVGGGKGKELRKIPEVVECHFTTGQYDMFIKLFARNNQHLLEIIHTKLQPIGLSRTETLISFREIFRRQLPIEEVEDLD